MTRPERFFAALGRFSVRFRWFVIAAWVAIAIIVSIALPSMGSEVNNDNSQFLPSSAPSEQAANLATPLIGNVSSQSQVIIVGSVEGRQTGSAPGHLTLADLAYVNSVTKEMAAVPGVTNAKVVGISTDGQAIRILVTTDASQSDISAQKPIVDDLQSTAAKANADPANPGISFHVAGPIATNVANQAQSNKTGNQVQSLSFLFIIVLLLLIFRSLLAPLITLAPAGIALVISMRLHRRPRGAHGAQDLRDNRTAPHRLDAGCWYGLRAVPGVPDPGGDESELGSQRGRGPRPGPGGGVDQRLGRDSHLRPAHPAAGQLRSLPRPRCAVGVGHRRDAAGRAHVVAGPAGRVRQGRFLAFQSHTPRCRRGRSKGTAGGVASPPASWPARDARWPPA